MVLGFEGVGVFLNAREDFFVLEIEEDGSFFDFARF